MANQYFNCALDGWRDGTTLYGRMHYWRTDGRTYTYQDTRFPDPTMNLAGSSYADTTLGNAVRGGVGVGNIYGGTFSRTVAGTGTRTISYSAGSGLRSDFAGSWSASVGGFPGTSSPPTNVGASNVRRGQNSFTANVTLGNWGTNNTGSGSRYRELQCWTYNASSLVEPRRYQAAYGDSLTGDITVSNNSSGSLTIMPNTKYTLGVYASNGAQNTGSQRVGDYTTLPPTPTISNVDVTTTTATFTYSVPDQGGGYNMALKYQLNGGSAVTVDTLTGSGTKAGTFTVSNLSSGTTYTITAALSTSAGEVVSNIITFDTATPNPKLYGPVNGVTKEIAKLYGPVTTTIVTGVSGTIRSGSAGIGAGIQFDGAVFWDKVKNVVDTSKTMDYLQQQVSHGGDSYYLTLFYTDETSYAFENGGDVDTNLYGITYTGTPQYSGLDYIDLTTTTTTGTVTKEIQKLYGSVNGQTKLVYQSSASALSEGGVTPDPITPTR